MAKKTKQDPNAKLIGNGPKVTSDGNSPNSRPKNKHRKRNWKKSRGQGSGRRR